MTKMKVLRFFSIIAVAALLLTSCSDDEEGTPQQTTQSYTITYNLRGSEGVFGTINQAVTLSLSDVIGTDAADNFVSASQQQAQSYLEISGLSALLSDETDVILLKDFTIQVGSETAINLGDCSTDPQGTNEFGSDTQQSTDDVIELIGYIFSDLTSGSKSTEISISFTPTVDITSADNVQLKINFGGTYHYEIFE